MRKLLFVIVLFMVFPWSLTQAQEAQNVAGVQFGTLLQNGCKPAMAYAIGTDISVTEIPLINRLFSKAETSFLYSDRKFDFTSEIYAFRVFTVKQYQFLTINNNGFYFGIGGGGYYTANSDGGDKGYLAGRVEVGAKIENIVEIYIGGDVLDVRGDSDLFYPHVSVAFLK